VLGGSKGVLCFFDLDSKNLNHINTQGFQMKNKNDDLNITFVDVSNNDSIVTIISANLIRQQYWIMNTNETDGDIQAIQPLFPNGFHNKKITSLSVAKLKTIFATCGEDNYVRIWNYSANPKAII
jgi:WD40 repeat protein